MTWPLWVGIALMALAWLAYGLWKQWRIVRSGIRDIDSMTGLQFEQYLASLFRQLGHSVERTSYQGDYGGDLIVGKSGIKTVIQAKRSRRRIGIRAIQEGVAAKGFYRCDSAIVVTNSFFTRQAATLAHRNGVSLWDRNRLAKAMASIGGKHAIAQTIPVATCAMCGQPVSEKVRDYCLANESRFAGRILCYPHQRKR
jgi:restriction system protein